MPLDLPELIKNNAVTTINQVGGISSSTATIPVANGAVFPALTTGDGIFRIKIDNEIIKVTARSGNTLTATGGRGAESTTASTHNNGATVRLVLTQESLPAVILDRKKAPTIEDYGGKAKVGFDNTGALQAALDDAGNTYYHVDFKSGRTYEFDGKVTFPNKTSIGIDGVTLKCTASPVLTGAFLEFKWDNGAGNYQGTDGGIVGQGRIEGNLACTWVIDINSWRGAHFRDFSFGNGTFGGMLLRSTNSAGPTSVGADCDSNTFWGLNHRTTNNLGVDEWDITKVAFRIDGTGTTGVGGGGRVTDNEFYSPVIIGGMRPETSAGASNGGIGFELINADRNTIMNPKCYSHFTVANPGGGGSLKWNYAFKLFADVTPDGCSGNVIYNPYVEATTTNDDPNGTNHANWKFWAVHADSDPGSHIDFLQVHGLQQSCDANGANAKRLETAVGAGATMHATMWRSPKNTMGSASQMSLASGMTAGHIEVLSAAEVAYVNLNGGTGVNVVNLQGI